MNFPCNFCYANRMKNDVPYAIDHTGEFETNTEISPLIEDGVNQCFESLHCIVDMLTAEKF